MEVGQGPIGAVAPKKENAHRFIINGTVCYTIMNKSRRMRWARHVARMGRKGIHIGYWWKSQKERDH
jgi:hypothetical protein